MGEHIEFTHLKNRYFIIRHGESEANVTGLITSDPVDCISNYGLTKPGREQVTSAITKAKLNGRLTGKTIIYSSDFKRAVETAEIARKILNTGTIHLNLALRERFFGGFNGTHPNKYIEIWPKPHSDMRTLQVNGVEGAAEMLVRLERLFKELETKYREECILLVSHGDPLQVLQAAFRGLNQEQSRLLRYIKPAEIRQLKQAS